MDGRGRALDNVFVERLWRRPQVGGYLPAGVPQCGESQKTPRRVLLFLQSNQVALLLRRTHLRSGTQSDLWNTSGMKPLTSTDPFLPLAPTSFMTHVGVASLETRKRQELVRHILF